MCILCAVHLAYLSASALRWLLGSENSLCWLTYLALDWIVRALWNPVQGEEVYKLDLGKGFLLAFLWRIFRVGLTCGKTRADSLSFSLLRSILHYLFVKWTWFSHTLRCTKRMIDCCRRLVNLVRIHQAEERGLLFFSSHPSFPSPPPSLSVSLVENMVLAYPQHYIFVILSVQYKFTCVWRSPKLLLLSVSTLSSVKKERKKERKRATSLIHSTKSESWYFPITQ